MTPEMHDIVQGMVRAKARQLKKNTVFRAKTVEDLEQDLWLRLLEAESAYDPGKGSWVGFAKAEMEFAGLKMIRAMDSGKEAAFRQARSIDEQVDTDEADNPVYLKDTIADPLPSLADEACCSVDVQAALSKLPDEFQAVAIRLMTRTQEEVAAEMGLPRRTFIDRYLPTIRAALRPALGLRFAP